MTTILTIDRTDAPALGDLREAGHGTCVYVREDAKERADWPRYWEAVGVAFLRGARVYLMWEES